MLIRLSIFRSAIRCFHGILKRLKHISQQQLKLYLTLKYCSWYEKRTQLRQLTPRTTGNSSYINAVKC